MFSAFGATFFLFGCLPILLYKIKKKKTIKDNQITLHVDCSFKYVQYELYLYIK
jgi:hypothetical protein